MFPMKGFVALVAQVFLYSLLVHFFWGGALDQLCDWFPSLARLAGRSES